MADEAPQDTSAETGAFTDTDDGEGSEPQYLDPAEVQLTRSPAGSLRLVLGYRVGYARVTARRIRPLSDPDHYIALWAGDTEEIGMIRDPAALAPESAALVAEELERRYFTPVITQILNLQERFGIQRWHVDSTHGKLSFYVRGLHQNIRRMPPDRLLITDVRDNRYDIPDVAALDRRSLMHIERHL